jgi:peptidyl-dipeptidase Dcp
MKKLFLLMIIPAIMLGSCKKAGENPFFTEWDTEYGMPPFDKINPEHYKPAFEEGMRLEAAEIEAIKNNPEEPSFENVILALDNAGQMLHQVGSVFGLVNSADSDDQLRAVEQEMTPLLITHSDNIALDPALFAKVKAVYDKRNELNLSELQMRLLDKHYKSFVRSGALLDDTQKEQLRRINTQIAEAEVKFRANLLAETQKFVMVLDQNQLSGLPEDLRGAGAETAKKMGLDGKWAFTLDHRIPLLTYASDRSLREQMYKAYIERCNHDDEFDNKQVVNDLARLRLERANLLGYESFAAYTLENRMAKTPEEVYALLDELWTPGLEGAKREVEQMREVKLRETDNSEFAAWDWWYYAEKVRKEKYNLEEEALKPYFSLPQVQSGIFDVANRLYGITFEPVKLPVYNAECSTYRVLDADGSHLAILMLDMHPREGKRVGAWCGAYRGREFNAAGEKTFDPIVYITCNFTRPVGKAPAMLTLDETETFFHEFGHALHNFFNMAPYKGLMSTERDFVELPSQIMENFAFQPEMLRQYAVKWDDKGAVIPEELIQKIRNAAYFNQGFISTEYVAASLIDMDLHTITEWQPLDVNAYERDLLTTRRGLIDQIAPRYRFPYFNHIFGSGYSAGYYGYKWAEVLDKDAFEAFAETGDIFNSEVATRFRNEILSKGGTADGMVLYHNFRGKEPNLDYLLYASGLKERPQTTDEQPAMLEVADPLDL